VPGPFVPPPPLSIPAPPCGCSHQQFTSFSGREDDCQSRSVPSAFGFLGGAVVSVTIPPRRSAVLGPVVFKPTVSVPA
jgi:hypothetical protein